MSNAADKNSQLITVKYICPTNYKGSRISFTSEYWKGYGSRNRKDYHAEISYDDEFDMVAQAQTWMRDHGYTVIARGSYGSGGYYFVVSECHAFNDTVSIGREVARNK